MTSKESLDIIKQRVNTIRLNTKIGSRTIADKENAILLDHIEYNLNKLYELVERDTFKKVIKDCDGMFRCPSCDGYVSDNVNDGYGSYEELFCDHCGQRLDWDNQSNT